MTTPAYVFLTTSLILGIWLYFKSLDLRAARLEVKHSQEKSKLALEDIRKSHLREIQRLIDALPHPFFSIDTNGLIIRVNRHAEKILKDREILGRSIRQIFLDPSLVSTINGALDKPRPISKVLRLSPISYFSAVYQEKSSHWEIDLQPVSINRDSLELQVFMRDITPTVHADQVRQDFVANASHELRTPLSIVSGYLENLNEDGALNDTKIAKKMLSTMNRHVERINRIVDDMLVISKLESADAAPLKFAPFSLAVCVRDIFERLEFVIEKQDAMVEVEVPEIQIVGDLFYWTQILFNLVENALKQNSAQPVKLRITAREDDEKENVIIAISDDGIGIPAGDLPHIFMRFFRVEKHHSQLQVKGTGLGLSIVKRAVEAHEGKISARSTPGVETTFEIIAPIKPNDPAALTKSPRN